ncbi:hypothetical protein BU16DRAFT_557557 [Lophium mytilinum]|uniref:Uncharacterized protein n=1 Tax=Lophium mytilinum TaxID=390894 RepID=A0A6A6R3Z4_9PEZI|nr:hypothetical protein BU16DRAFT_557557 [Lophium mytilinum]
MQRQNEQEKSDTARHTPFTTTTPRQHNDQHTSQPTTSPAGLSHGLYNPITLRPSHPSTDRPQHIRPQGGMAPSPFPTPYPLPTSTQTSTQTDLVQYAHPQQPQPTFSTYSIPAATHHSPQISPLSQISPLTHPAHRSPVSPIPISPLTREALARHNAITASQPSPSSQSPRRDYRPHPPSYPPQYPQQQRKPSAPRKPSEPLAIVASTRRPTEALLTPFPGYSPPADEAEAWAWRGARVAAAKAQGREKGFTGEKKRQVRFRGEGEGKGGDGKQQQQRKANFVAELRAIHATGPRGEGERLARVVRAAWKGWGKGRGEVEGPVRGDPIRGSAWRVPELPEVGEGLKVVRYEETMPGRAPKFVERITTGLPPLSMESPVEKGELERRVVEQTRQTDEERASEKAIPLPLHEFNAKALEVYKAHQRRKEEERRAALGGNGTSMPLPEPRKSNESPVAIYLAERPEIYPTRPARPTRPETLEPPFFGLQPLSFSSPRTPAKTSADGCHRDVPIPQQPLGQPRRSSPRPPPPSPIVIPQVPARQALVVPAPERPERSPTDPVRNAAMRNPVPVRPFPQSLRSGRAQETKQEQTSPLALLSRWQQKLVRSPAKAQTHLVEGNKQENGGRAQTLLVPEKDREDEKSGRGNDISKAVLGTPKEKKGKEDMRTKLKAMISSPGPLMSTDRNAVNISAASGGIGGLHAALSLPFRSNSTREAEKPLPPPPTRKESGKKAAKEKKPKTLALETAYQPMILSAKHNRLSTGTTLSDFMHPELGKSVFSRLPKTPKIPRKPVQKRKGSDESFACQGIEDEGELEAPSSPTSIYRSGLPPSVYGQGTLSPEVQTARIDSDMSFFCKGPYDDDGREHYESSTPRPRYGAGPSSPARGFNGRHGGDFARVPSFPGYGQHVAEARAPPARTQVAPGARAEKRSYYSEFEGTDDEAEYTPRPLVLQKSANNTPVQLPPVQEEAMSSPPGVQRPRPRDTQFYEPYRKLLEEYE